MVSKLFGLLRWSWTGVPARFLSWHMRGFYTFTHTFSKTPSSHTKDEKLLTHRWRNLRPVLYPSGSTKIKITPNNLGSLQKKVNLAEGKKRKQINQSANPSIHSTFQLTVHKKKKSVLHFNSCQLTSVQNKKQGNNNTRFFSPNTRDATHKQS